jgi:RNA polymerase sigma-70 factor (ECF subfamily)
VIDPHGSGQGASVVSVRPRPEPQAPTGSVPAEPDGRDFDALVNQHLDFVWRLLRRLGLSPADADDAAQQVFMIAARKQGELPLGTERAFLYGTARRTAANARRDRRRRGEVADGLAGELASEERHPGAGPEELVELRRASSLLDALLERLPDELRRVLILAELEEATVPAIAELEDIPIGTAASRLRRARAAFAELLRGAEAQNPFRGSE